MFKKYLVLASLVTIQSGLFANEESQVVCQPEVEAVCQPAMEPVCQPCIPEPVECCIDPCCPTAYCDLGNDTEIRVAYFYPISKRFREIFRGARIDYEIETAQTILPNLAIWANVSWFPKSGHSIGGHEHTRVNLVPISAGLKYIWWINCWTRLRIGLGPSYFFLNTRDHCCHNQNNNYSHFGLAAKSDVSFFWGCRFYTDVFLDYLYLPLHSRGIHDAGGLKAGIGLGYHF